MGKCSGENTADAVGCANGGDVVDIPDVGCLVGDSEEDCHGSGGSCRTGGEATFLIHSRWRGVPLSMMFLCFLGILSLREHGMLVITALASDYLVSLLICRDWLI